MRSFIATKSTMQCTVFIPAKNEEMTKHPFLTSGLGAPLKIQMPCVTILNLQYPLAFVHFQYPPHISDTLPTFLISFQYFQYLNKTQCVALFDTFEFPIPCLHFKYSLIISKTQCFTLDRVTMRHPVRPVSPPC